MPRGTVLEGLMPRWVVSLCQVDMSNALQADMAQFETTEAWFLARCLERGVRVSLFDDGEVVAPPNNQVFAAQYPGGLFDFPSELIWYVYPAGSWVYLDGGGLDLGVVRDSVLNATNDAQSFVEVWEAAANVGVESLKVTSQICSNGLGAGRKDTSAACSGYSFGS